MQREYWSLKAEMLVWQAAYLWNDLTPPKTYPGDNAPPRVRVEVDRMKKGLELGILAPAKSPASQKSGLVAVLDIYVNRTEYATVQRDALLAYAEKVGEKPAFLYPSV